MKKFLIIAAIVVVVIVIVIVVIFLTKGKQFMELAIDKGFNNVESMMVANRPASIPEDSIRTVVSSTADKIKSGEVSPQEFQAIMLHYRECLEDEQLDSLEVIDLLEEMNDL
jgi:hypothetical protein